AAHLIKGVGDYRLPHSRLVEMFVFLADAPADVEPGQIAHREWTHRHAEIVKRPIDSLGRSAFLDQQLRLAEIGKQHPIAHKSAAIPYQYTDLVQFPCESHGSGDHLRFG